MQSLKRSVPLNKLLVSESPKLYVDVVSTILSYLHFDHMMLQARRVSKLWYDAHFLPTSYPVVDIHLGTKVHERRFIRTFIGWCRRYFSHSYVRLIRPLSDNILYDIVKLHYDKSLAIVASKYENINQPNKHEGLSLIKCALLYGSDRSVEILIKNGCNIYGDEDDDDDLPPLAVVQNINQLHLLIDAGSDINYSDEDGGIFEMMVAKRKHDIALEFLKTPGLEMRDQYLTVTLVYGNAVLVEAVLNIGHHDVNRIEDDDPVIFKCFRNRVDPLDVFKTMVKHGASITHRGLLHSAVRHNCIPIVGYMVFDLFDVNETDDHGCTPLFYAKSVEAATLLMEFGADVNARDPAGHTPLFSVTLHSSATAKYLTNEGADKMVVDDYGNTIDMYINDMDDNVEGDD